MITLDTNVLVRILVDDPGNTKQNEIARSVVLKYDQFFIPQVVQVELGWVLAQSYKFDKDIIIKALKELQENNAFKLESESCFEKALHLFKKENIDFADCIIHESSKENKAKKVLTFDKKFSRVSSVTLLK